MKEDIKHDFDRLEKVRTETANRIQSLLRKRETLERNEEQRQFTLAEAMKKKDSLLVRSKDLALRKKGAECIVVNLEYKAMKRESEGAGESSSESAELQTNRDEIRILEEKMRLVEEEKEDVGRYLKELENIRIGIQGELEEIKEELDEGPSKESDDLVADLRELFKKAADLRRKLADINHSLIMAYSAQQQHFWTKKLDEIILPETESKESSG